MDSADNHEGPEHYRERAADMLRMADAAHTDAVKLFCLQLAASWNSLAEQAEKTDAVQLAFLSPAEQVPGRPEQR